ncbi:MAG: DedA family protein [Muribaculaceae bacterium]|nr:DedA family protein [Muribaculaceae bacterium]
MIDLLINLSISDYFSASFLFQWFVDHANYWFVFIFMVVESSFIPFPSEVVVPPAAYLAVAQGSNSDMNLFGVIGFATLGALIGSLINYYLALWVGRPIVYAFANSRVGHACMINQAKVEHAEEYFDKHGSVSTFIGRLIPVIRQLISIPAGLARMNIVKFIIFTGLGALIWNVILGFLGYFLAKTVALPNLFDKVEQYNSYLTIAGFSLLGLCIIYIAYKALSNKSENKNLIQ